MEELLAVTDAAVKALDKSAHSSGSSHASKGSSKHDPGQGKSYSDSGIGKTYTAMERRNTDLVSDPLVPVHDSDDSTTASEVLIHSTTVDPDEKSFSHGISENASILSKCSKSSIGSENFNNFGPQKIKISTKRLREIKSPFESELSPRNAEQKEVPRALQSKEKSLVNGVNSSNRKVYILRGSDGGDKNLGQYDVDKLMSSKNLQLTSSPSGSQRSTASEKSQRSLYSEKSQKSTHSERSQVSVYSARSQKSAHSERSQVSVHSARSQKSAHSEMSHVSVHSETPNSVHTERSHISVHSNGFQENLSTEHDKSQKSIASNHSNVSGISEGSGKSEQSVQSHQSVQSKQSHQSLNRSKLSDHSVNSHASQLSHRSHHSGRESGLEQEQKFHRSEKLYKGCTNTSFPWKKGPAGASDSKTDDKNVRVTENGVEYSPSDKGEPPDVVVERHTPKKLFPAERKKLFPEELDIEADVDEQVAAELNGSLDLLPQRENENNNTLQTSVHSFCSSQPEIVTIPERIVTVAARTSLSSSSDISASDPGGLKMEQEERIPPKLPARFQLLSKAHGHGKTLRQGAPVEGAGGIEKQRQSPDVRISNYQLSEKQKYVKQMFSKRYEESGPVRRVVQPKLVHKDQKFSEESDSGNKQKLNSQATETITAAVAASAAVAATQPFLKAQQDLENKMAQILEKMADLQGVDRVKQIKTHDPASERVMELEKQVSQLTEQRIEHLEKLQESHMQMQAKLLSLTRTSPSMPRSHITSPVRSPPEQRKFPGADYAPRKAFSKTTVHKSTSPPGDRKGQSQNRRTSPLDTPNPRSRAPKPVAYESSSSHSLANENQKSKGILEEILASAGSPQGKGGLSIQQPVYTRENEHTHIQPRSPNVQKAEKLVEELSTLKDQTTDLVTNVQQTALKPTDDKQMKTIFSRGITEEELLGPSPLDPYLVQRDGEPSSPYKYVPNLSPSRFNAPVRSPPGFSEAKQVLQQVGRNKAYLEANMESVLQSRQEVEVFTMLENVYQDNNDRERAHIQHKVNDWVSNLRQQVEREVTDDVVMAELTKKHRPVQPFKAPRAAPMSSQYVKPGMKISQKGLAGSKIDTGLRKDRKPLGSAANALVDRLALGDKENKPTSTTVAAKRPRVKKAGGPLHPDDEKYMTRVYGKAAYQNKRSTLKGDPYLHYQNSPQQKAPRTPLVHEVKGTEVKSSKTQTYVGVKQFYFSPASGSYIPVASVNTAPIPGQLIPMAVPLSGPRMEGGLTAPVTLTTPSGPVTSTPVPHPVVTAADNVAMVSVPAIEEEDEKTPTPELGKQVLPAVDIDTDLSEASVGPVSGTVHLKSPQGSPVKAKYEVTYHREEGEQEEDSEADLSYEDLPPEKAPGLALPGYCPPSPPQVEERPSFPPQMSGAEKLTQASDLIAADIHRRDVLEYKAAEWIEQELMARMISELYPLKPEEPKEMPHVDYEESVDSVSEDPNQSMFLMDAIGRDGLQLFVDAGQPVDSKMVNAMIREVLMEKVSTMLGQCPGDEKPQGENVERRGEAKLGATGMETIEVGMSPQDEYDGMIRTPEPTPKASPISSPTRVLSPPVTPPESPPGMRIEPQQIHQTEHVELPPLESEPESESLDISEELRNLKAKLVVSEQSVEEVHDVVTPMATPIPELSEEEQVPVTPPMPSPRQQAKETITQIPAPHVSVAPPGPHPEPPVKEEIIDHDRTESPQPWAESPIPEENPDFFENDGYHTTQGPYALTVAPTEEQIGFIPPSEVHHLSPAPVARKASRSPSPTETESLSIMSSVTDTSNMEVSEGQWLLCKSEGEIADFNIDEAAMHRMAQQFKHRPDLSTASTLHSTDDIQDETADLPISEGEFQYKPSVAPEQDPVLVLLSKFQSHKMADTQEQYGNAGHYGLPEQYGVPGRGHRTAGQYNMTSHQVQDLLNYTGKSTGEISFNGMGGVSVKRSVGEVIRVAESKKSLGDANQHHYPTRDADRYINTSVTDSLVSRNGSTLRMTDLKKESIQEESEEDDPQSGHDRHEKTKVTPSTEEQKVVTPMRDGRTLSSRGRPSPQRGGPRMSPGGVSLGAGGRTSPVKSAMKRPPQAGKSQGMPERSVTLQSRGLTGQSSDDQGLDSQEYGQSTMSDGQGTRTFTPDQMNMEALIQSGYLTQTFSQSGEFGQSGGLSHSQDRHDTMESHDSLRQKNRGKSLGLTYSFEEEGGATDTLDESELRQLATAGTLKMNVTIPGLEGMEDDSENVSEIDMTEGNTT